MLAITDPELTVTQKKTTNEEKGKGKKKKKKKKNKRLYVDDWDL